VSTTRSIKRATDELEKAYHKLKPMFKGINFPKPVIIIQTKGRKNALGWFAKDRWKNSDHEIISEITITAEHLKAAVEVSVEEIADTLLHEMCHYANFLEGISDCNLFGYHNRHFKVRAESVGFTVTRNGGHGWSGTKPTPALLTRLKALKMDAEAFAVFRDTPERAKKPTSKLIKWSCGCPRSCWAKVDLEGFCCRKCRHEVQRCDALTTV
jgi:hypothetical protein